MPNVNEIEYKEKKILQTTFPKGATLQTVMATLDETRTLYGKYTPRTILSLFIFDSMENIDNAFVNFFEQVAKNSLKIMKATSFVGFTPEQKGLFNAMISITGMKAQLFDTVGAANDWLVSPDRDDDGMCGF